MPDDPRRPLLAQFRDELGMFGAELRESVALRWQLAALEIKADLRSTGRLAIALASAAVLGLSILPVLLGAAAIELDGCWNLSTAGWLLAFAAALLLLALMIGWLAWRRFRRRFIGLQQTLEELREDEVWLREWLHKPAAGSRQRAASHRLREAARRQRLDSSRSA
jgi:hypothetical protein